MQIKGSEGYRHEDCFKVHSTAVHLYSARRGSAEVAGRTGKDMSGYGFSALASSGACSRLEMLLILEYPTFRDPRALKRT
jgi:hypothetical protein